MEYSQTHYGVMCDNCKACPIIGSIFKCPYCPNSDSCGNCVKKYGTCGKCHYDLCFAYQLKNVSGWANGRCKRCSKNVDYCLCTGKNTTCWDEGRCKSCAKNVDYCICGDSNYCTVNWSNGKCTRCSKNVEYCVCGQGKNTTNWNNGKCTACSKNVDYCICGQENSTRNWNN